MAIVNKQDFANGNTYDLTPTLPSRYYDPEHKGYCFCAWVYYHSVADSFPMHPSEDEITRVRIEFNVCLPVIFPCAKCGQHLQQELTLKPILARNGPEFSREVYDLHNRVNERLGKPKLSYEDCRKMQEWLRSIHFGNLIEDLKKSCQELCKHDQTELNKAGAGTNNYHQQPHQCFVPKTPEDFRKFDSNDTDSDIAISNAQNKTLKNYKIASLILLLTSLLLSLTLLNILFFKKGTRDDDNNNNNNNRRVINNPITSNNFKKGYIIHQQQRPIYTRKLICAY